MNAVPPPVEVSAPPVLRVKLVDGTEGVIDQAEDSPGEMTQVRLDDGTRVAVRTGLLQRQSDGSLLIPLQRADLPVQSRSTDQIISVVQEEARVTKVEGEIGRVAVHVTPHIRDEVVDVPLIEEHVDVERVEVNRFVNGPVAVRQEGNVTIVPVLEEVIVIEKRMLLREEVRLTRRQETRRHRERVSLRTEEAQVLRAVDPPSGEIRSS